MSRRIRIASRSSTVPSTHSLGKGNCLAESSFSTCRFCTSCQYLLEMLRLYYRSLTLDFPLAFARLRDALVFAMGDDLDESGYELSL